MNQDFLNFVSGRGGLVIPASMLLITALGRHWWTLRDMARETERKRLEASKLLERFRGLGGTSE